MRETVSSAGRGRGRSRHRGEALRGSLLAALAAATLAAVAFAGSSTTPAAVARVALGASLGAIALAAIGGMRRAAAPAVAALAPRGVPWAGLALLLSGIVVLGPGLVAGEGGRFSDYGVHTVAVAELADGFAHGELRRWTHLVGAGMPLADLYPLPAYVLAAGLVWPFGLSVPSALAWVAALSHLAMALATTHVARRVAREPWACLAGLLVLLDRGVPETLGTWAIFKGALFHEALAVAAFSVAAAALLDHLAARPLEHPDGTPRRALRVWLGTALGLATHPLLAVSVAAAVAGLLLALAVARDASRPRVLLGLRDLAVGALLGGALFGPLALQVAAHGLPFGSPGAAPEPIAQALLDAALPHVSWRIAIGLAFVGAVAAVASRRAGPTLLAMLAIAPLAIYAEDVFLALRLAASPSVAAFPAQRMGGLAKPYVFALVAFGLDRAVAAAGAWGGSRSRRAPPLGPTALALTSVAMLFAARGMAPHLRRIVRDMQAEQTAPLPAAARYAARVAWGRARRAELAPGRIARVLVRGAAEWQHAFASASGLPLVSTGYAPGQVFREQPIGEADEVRRRFNIRWVWTTPDADTERASPGDDGAGLFHEVPGWDGAFARVEGGAGDVRVRRMEPERIDLALQADAPARVVLGMGWFPRWRAVHEDGTPVPIVPAPAAEGSPVRVAALRLPPGRTTLRCDRWLPGDVLGLVCLVLGGLAARAAWRAHTEAGPRLRARRRWLAWHRAARRLRGRVPLAPLALAGLAVALALAAGARAGAPVRALHPSNGLLPSGRVEARSRGRGAFRACDWSTFEGLWHCPGVGRVRGALVGAFVLRPGAWASIAPSTAVYPRGDGEVRVTYERVALAGRYRVATHGRGRAEVRLGGRRALRPGPGGAVLDFERGAAPRDVSLVLRAESPFFVAFVREDTLGSAVDTREPTRAVPR